jgi:hypothetical protein
MPRVEVVARFAHRVPVTGRPQGSPHQGEDDAPKRRDAIMMIDYALDAQRANACALKIGSSEPPCFPDHKLCRGIPVFAEDLYVVDAALNGFNATSKSAQTERKISCSRRKCAAVKTFPRRLVTNTKWAWST